MKILKPLKKLFRWITGNKDKVKLYIHASVQVAEKFKQAIDSEWLTSVTALTKGTWDDKMLAKLRVAVHKVVERMKLVDKYNNFVLSSSAMKEIRLFDQRTFYVTEFAGELCSELTGLPLETAIEETQNAYKSGEVKVTA